MCELEPKSGKANGNIKKKKYRNYTGVDPEQQDQPEMWKMGLR